jgi:ZIP family zinc transporter
MTFSFSSIAIAFGLTLLAGLATGIGSCIAFFAKQTNTRFLCVSLGFSAGVMLYVSFVEIMDTARQTLTASFGATAGNWYTALAFFGGIACIAAIDRLVPGSENPHELRSVEDVQGCVGTGECALPEDREQERLSGLRRTGVFTALAIGIHNFPEGLATFTMSLSHPSTGVAIAVAIAIHNIPEGIAVSVPMYYATGSRTKAFTWSFLSGLAEPVGALVGFLVLLPFLTPGLMGTLFAGVAGIMVYISLDELLPAAERYGEHHLCIYGLIAGMAVMAVSLLLML